MNAAFNSHADCVIRLVDSFGLLLRLLVLNKVKMIDMTPIKGEFRSDSPLSEPSFDSSLTGDEYEFT